MNGRILVFSLLALLAAGLDLWFSGALRHRLRPLTARARNALLTLFLINSAAFSGVWIVFGLYQVDRTKMMWLFVFVIANLCARIFAFPFIAADDVRRLALAIKRRFSPPAPDSSLAGQAITRSEFLTKSALYAASLPVATLGYGILSGAHDYRIQRLVIRHPALPKAFHGFRLAQLSDIHTGSFTSRRAVEGGVDLLLAEKPDLVVFTGDLVNVYADELNGWRQTFERVKAPYGVFSVLGNHDYSDYGEWATAEARIENARRIAEGSGAFGWTLLRNELRTLEAGGERIGLIGSENWGAGRFSKYGNLEKAAERAGDQAFNLLLSHDPTHWRAQVLGAHPNIQLQLAGHTHGAQFGVEWGDLRWSPAQYLYREWAGLYQENLQYLYVNRGFGYIGIPGRMGIPPEITLIELQCA